MKKIILKAKTLYSAALEQEENNLGPFLIHAEKHLWYSFHHKISFFSTTFKLELSITHLSGFLLTQWHLKTKHKGDYRGNIL